MEKNKNCEECGILFAYNVPENYPDRRKYCSKCSVAKKAQWEAKKIQDLPKEAKATYDKFAAPQNNTATTGLMSAREIGMCAGGLMKCYSEIGAACIIAQSEFNREQIISDLVDAYNLFVKKLENNE
jgi:hypothetical protein